MNITVEANPVNVKSGGKSTITATVIDGNNKPVKDEEVTFTLDDATKGDVNPQKFQTNDEGKAQTTLEPKPAEEPDTITVIATTSRGEGKKPIGINMTDLDINAAELKALKIQLQEQKAQEREIEEQIKALEDASQAIVKVIPPPQAVVDAVEEYGKANSGFTTTVSIIQDKLKQMTDPVKAKVTSEQQKAIDTKRGNITKDIDEKKKKKEQLERELEQLQASVTKAELEVQRQTEAYRKTKETQANVKAKLDDLSQRVKDLETDYKGGRPSVQILFYIQEYEQRSKDISSLLIKTEEFRKKLEGEWKSLEEAKQSLRQEKVKAAEKQGELDKATSALENADDLDKRKPIIENFINSIASA
ncbi:MAG: Ig-like domain-containing protein [Anaerolineae bacterium]|nr:Ig-like domain-containing protein [Anaerolineae bacterium]